MCEHICHYPGCLRIAPPSDPYCEYHQAIREMREREKKMNPQRLKSILSPLLRAMEKDFQNYRKEVSNMDRIYGIVEKVEKYKTKTGKTMSFFTVGGERLKTFDNLPIKEGDYVKIEFQKDKMGDEKIMSYEIINPQQKQKPQQEQKTQEQKTQEQKPQQEKKPQEQELTVKDKLILKQVALKCACEWGAEKYPDPEVIIASAQVFYHWLLKADT